LIEIFQTGSGLYTYKKEVFMVKKLFVIPLIWTSMVFLMQCTDDPLYQSTDDQASETTAAVGKKGGGGHTEAAVNNLSFPVIAVDGFSIIQIPSASFLFTAPYTGPYTGLTAADLAILGDETWYAQKVTGNVWQAEFSNADAPLSVAFIDWGDVIEAVNPKIGRPFRLEVTPYANVSSGPMTGYTMALLANPSSPNEVQGTNRVTYPGIWATVASSLPTLIIQFIQGADPATLSWNGSEWVSDGTTFHKTPIVFAPELNVGGKYIYGTSSGGWKPTVAGLYRLTFYMRGTSKINLGEASIGNYDGNVAGWGIPESTAAKPTVDAENNLTYVDVTVVSGGGGSGKPKN
jgi:hypothetical protein